MSTTLQTTPAAGWYHDPADAGAWRWWDGATWTGHVRAKDAAPDTTESAPVTAPRPVTTSSIPQPGQVAAAPAITGTPVPSTPETPVSDQMYWHSAAAEVIEVPRMTHSVHHDPRNAPRYVRDWQDLGSPNTTGIWLMASMPLLGIVIGMVLGFVNGLSGVASQTSSLITAGVVLGLNWVFAYLDQRALAQRGYHAPAIWWMLLIPPLAYLIARGRSVRRESMRAWPPELLYVMSVVLVTGSLVVGLMYLTSLGVPITAIG